MTVIVMDMLNEVLLPVFSEWLEILDIGNLDSALCNQTQRSSFLDLISNSFFVHHGTSLIDSKFFFSWISLRKIKVKNIHLRRWGKVTTTILSILKASKNFDKLVFNSNMAVALSRQYFEIETKSLELTVFENDEKYSLELSDRDFEDLIIKIRGIQTLQITAVSSLTDQAFNSVVQHCPMLKDISVNLEGGSLTSDNFFILFHGCKHLTNVTINSLEDDTALEFIAEYAPQVTHLTLDYMTCLEDDESRLVRVAEHGNIEYLDLCSCNANSLLETIRLCPRLTYLSADDDTGMSDETMTALADTCPLLTHLSTSSYEHSNNDYTDVGVCAVATKCRQLKVLKLYHTMVITDTSILCIAQHCLDLTELEILQNTLCSNDAMQSLLNSLVHLKLFSFRGNVHLKVDDILIRLTQDATHLTLDDKKFYVAAVDRNCSISGQSKEIGCCVDSRNNFSLSSIKIIAQQCTVTLQHISLLGFTKLSDDHMLTIFSNCPLINSVFLFKLPALTVITIEIMTQNCPLLDTLQMHSPIEDLNDGTLVALLTNKPHFKSLQLIGNYSKLTNTFVSHIAINCLNIKTVEITGNKNITNSAVCDMIKHCSKLHKLSLRQCTNITCRVLTAIVMYSHTLRSLDIEGCDKIKSREIVQFLQDYTELTEPLWHTL